jgi:hypothetical protein
MTDKCPSSITCEQDARDFFRYLYKVENLSFHPDDSFEGYVRFGTGEPCFDAEQCKKYNSLMTQTFEVCCPYTVGMEVGRQEGFIDDDLFEED